MVEYTLEGLPIVTRELVVAYFPQIGPGRSSELFFSSLKEMPKKNPFILEHIVNSIGVRFTTNGQDPIPEYLNNPPIVSDTQEIISLYVAAFGFYGMIEFAGEGKLPMVSQQIYGRFENGFDASLDSVSFDDLSKEDHPNHEMSIFVDFMNHEKIDPHFHELLEKIAGDIYEMLRLKAIEEKFGS